MERSENGGGRTEEAYEKHNVEVSGMTRVGEDMYPYAFAIKVYEAYIGCNI